MTRKSLPLSKAIALSLEELPQPAVTAYQLGVIIYRLYVTKTFQGQKLDLAKPRPSSREYSTAVTKLLNEGFLKAPKYLPENRVFEIYGRHDAKAEEIACVVDPFCYVSHLSAMAHHGLTNRFPKTLYLSSPRPPQWKQFAIERMQRDYAEHFDDYSHSGFPRLTRTRFDKIGSRPVEYHHRSHPGAYRSIRGNVLRVATIGRTFLDMLREPKLCGGINHVLEIYSASAKEHFRLIVDEIEKHGDPIDKVRAGYVLEERCGLSDPVIESWRVYVQRGGSRKLDASEEYSSRYSEKWSISLNVIEERKD